MSAPLIIAITLAAVALFIGILLFIFRKHRHIAHFNKLQLLAIETGSPLNEREEIDRTTRLITEIGKLRIPFAFEAVIHGVGEDVHRYLAVPRGSVRYVHQLVAKLWPTGRLYRAHDYELICSGGVTAGGYLISKSNSVTVVPTTDHFATLMHQRFGKPELIAEGVALQTIVSPSIDGDLKVTARLIVGAASQLTADSLLKGVATRLEPLRLSRARSMSDFESVFFARSGEDRYEISLTAVQISRLIRLIPIGISDKPSV